MKKSIFAFTYQDRLWLCFLLGTIGGTIIANLLSRELQSQIGYFDTLFSSGQILSVQEKQRLWMYVARQRCIEVMVAWLVSLTVFSAAGFYGFAGLAGGSSAIVLSVITGQKGIMGLPFYLATILPQGILYILVWLVLAQWAGERARPIRIRAMGILLLLVVIGAALEVYINPVLIEILKML